MADADQIQYDVRGEKALRLTQKAIADGDIVAASEYLKQAFELGADDDELFELLGDFYGHAVKMSLGGGQVLLNTREFQVKHWQQSLNDYDWNAEQLYGYDWGDPKNANDPLGNYLEVLNRVQAHITPESTILEIGSLAGKWIQYFLEAKKIVCVDVNPLGFKYIKEKLEYNNFVFYLTRGDELRGVADQSVDLVFSMDCLVRVDEESIWSYLRESQRVLTKGGKIFLHLPCVAMKGSRERDFIPLKPRDLREQLRLNGLGEISMDREVLQHGLFVEATKL